MRIRSGLLPVFSAFFAFLMAGPASAGSWITQGWYAGVSVAVTHNNADNNDIFYNPSLCTTTHTCSADNSDWGYQLFAGKQLMPYLALEFGYTDLGNTADYKYTQIFSKGTLTQKTHVLSLVAVGRLPVMQTGISLVGKVGAAKYYSRLKYDRTPNSVGFYDRKVKDSGITPVVGVGVEYDTGYRITLRAGWDRYFNIGERSKFFDVGNNRIYTAKTDVDAFYIGASYGF